MLGHSFVFVFRLRNYFLKFIVLGVHTLVHLPCSKQLALCGSFQFRCGNLPNHIPTENSDNSNFRRLNSKKAAYKGKFSSKNVPKTISEIVHEIVPETVLNLSPELSHTN